MLALATAAVVLVLTTTETLGTAHNRGSPVTLRPKALERFAFFTYTLDEMVGIEISLPSTATAEPLAVNHLQLYGPSFGEGRRISSVSELVTGGMALCSSAEIEVRADGDVLRSIEEASDSLCAGAVEEGGPIGSDLVLLGWGRIMVRFNALGSGNDRIGVGVVSYPGSTVTVQGFA